VHAHCWHPSVRLSVPYEIQGRQLSLHVLSKYAEREREAKQRERISASGLHPLDARPAIIKDQARQILLAAALDGRRELEG